MPRPHNTFTHYRQGHRFFCRSHNFPDIVGEGNNQQQALNSMINKITELKERAGPEFQNRVKQRTRDGLLCLCGIRLTSNVIGYI